MRQVWGSFCASLHEPGGRGAPVSGELWQELAAWHAEIWQQERLRHAEVAGLNLKASSLPPLRTMPTPPVADDVLHSQYY